MTRTAFSEVWVCFEPPAPDPPADALILSFMPPTVEAAMVSRFGAQVVGGRAVVERVRERARAEYVALIARIGSTPIVKGRTLRQALVGPGGYSRWWFLGPTEKDCVWDEDTIYVTILRLMAIRAVCDQYGIEGVRSFAAPAPVAAALRESGSGLRAVVELAVAIVRGLAARMVLVLQHLRIRRLLANLPKPERRDVLLQAYWDWSVQSARDGTLHDRYFTSLPQELASRGLTVGWLASYEPHAVRDSSQHRDLTILERYLTLRDVLSVVANLRYGCRTVRFMREPAFRKLCTAAGFDVYPLIRTLLLRSAWGSAMCRLELVALATSRACQELRPKMVLTFLEMFLRARAFYAGLRASAHRAPAWAAQHAGYSSDKTLGIFDAGIEVQGTPDGCAVPAPDGIFVMGDLSRRIWERNGFGAHQVIPTGGLRYQSIQVRSRSHRPAGSVKLLLVCGMNEAAELDLCDAALGAASGLGVQIFWRDHPFYRFSEREAFRRFRPLMMVTTGSLEDDLDAADIVLFTHSGVGEEAVLRGIPTWQWLWGGFNTSPFLDVPLVPSFASVADLRDALHAFLADPVRYRPDVDTQQRVLQECFGQAPSGAAARIASAVEQMVQSDLRVLQ